MVGDARTVISKLGRNRHDHDRARRDPQGPFRGTKRRSVLDQDGHESAT